MRTLAILAALLLTIASAEARRVALVIGQNAYPGGRSATTGLPPLDNPVRDARRLAELLVKHGFEVIACDGGTPGCFDLDRSRFLQALARLEQRAAGADLALIFFAGHGMATDEGNMLTPTDASVDCATGAIRHGVPADRIMAATQPARHKLLILDACRDNPLDGVCPGLKGKKLAFTRIEAGANQGFLLVTSTQFGQQALDGPADSHSPFASALFAALEAHPNVYFEQVMNEVARATYEAAQKQAGFLQIPGRVVGGVAPADCLAGKGCIGDIRMAALAVENERLAADAAGVRAILAGEEKTRGKSYTAEERQKRVAELQETITRLGTSTNPLRREARRLIGQGNVTGGRAKLDEALDGDEKALAEAERVAAERRKAAAQSARDLAVLTRGTDILKALTYFQRAARLDPSDPATWDAYARAAKDAGRTGEAKAAFEQAAVKAAEAKHDFWRYWATLGLGDIAMVQGSLPDALRHYQTAVAILEPAAKARPDNAGLQRDLAGSQGRIGDVLRAQGNLAAAQESYRAAFAIYERLAKADPGNAYLQREFSVLHERIGAVHRAQGDLFQALESQRAAHVIAERLARANPGNTGLQRDLAGAQGRMGDVVRAQGNLAAALEIYRASLAIRERLAKADPGNAQWQRDLSASHGQIGDVLHAQGGLAQALESYRASLAIRERLVKSDPGNTQWQRNLSASLRLVGDVLHDQGSLTQALESYRASLAIRERLTKVDPGNAQWQGDFAIAHGRVAVVLARQGARSEAVLAFEQGRAIIVRLRQLSPDNANLTRDLAWFEAQLKALRN